MGVGAEGSNVPPAPPHFTSALTPPTLPPSTQPPTHPPTQPKLPTLPCLPCSQPAAAVSGPPADRAAPVPLPGSRLPNMGEQSRLLLGRHWSESQGSFSLVMTEGKVKYTQLCLREFHGKKTVFSLYAELQRVIHYCLSSVFWDQPSYGMCFINWHSSQGKHSHTHGRTQEHIPHSHVWFVYTLTPSHTAWGLGYNSLPHQEHFVLWDLPQSVTITFCTLHVMAGAEKTKEGMSTPVI